MATNGEAPTLFTVLDTPVKVKPAVLGNLLASWGVLSRMAGRRHPERSWPARLMVGALSTATLVVADIGHAMAHIVSACYAGAPMDEILVSPEMPRTIYFDNDVPPQAHRMRALGGPIYSALGLLSSLLLRGLAPRDSLAHELAGWSCIGHGFIFTGSLAPLPIVDGGSILKWTLVERGRTPAEADAVVQRVDLASGTPRAVIEQLLRENPYLPGARETVAALQARDVHVAIISSGPLIQAEMVADELGIGPVFGNEILFESDGAGWVVSGRVRAHVALHGKGAALEGLQARLNVAPDQCLAVGDAVGDVPLFERAAVGVAVNPGRPEVAAAADIVLREPDLRPLLRCLHQHAPHLWPWAGR